jgi:hypothetical protein
MCLWCVAQVQSCCLGRSVRVSKSVDHHRFYAKGSLITTSSSHFLQIIRHRNVLEACLSFCRSVRPPDHICFWFLHAMLELLIYAVTSIRYEQFLFVCGVYMHFVCVYAARLQHYVGSDTATAFGKLSLVAKITTCNGSCNYLVTALSHIHTHFLSCPSWPLAGSISTYISGHWS